MSKPSPVERYASNSHQRREIAITRGLRVSVLWKPERMTEKYESTGFPVNSRSIDRSVGERETVPTRATFDIATRRRQFDGRIGIVDPRRNRTDLKAAVDFVARPAKFRSDVDAVINVVAVRC